MHDPARQWLDTAARAALRGSGRVEPNPMVGCVIVGAEGVVAGIGHHRVFGGPHAEIDALAACRAARRSTQGATAYVTLEPCNHHGKTGPCSEALIAAGITRVVCARRDTHPDSGGGIERLIQAGVECHVTSISPLATGLAEPFLRRVRAGLPWVVAKWAQTIDGRIATRTGASQWISNERSRRMVHLLRARTDAILTGVGTVLADDPRLTARGVPVRRVARRIIIDPTLRTPQSSKLVQTAAQPPTTIITDPASNPAARAALVEAGVDLLDHPAPSGRFDLREVLFRLAAERGVATLLLESGPGLLGSLLDADLVNEAHVFTGPLMLADADAAPAATGRTAPTLADARRFALWRVKQLGDDVLCVYKRPLEPSP